MQKKQSSRTRRSRQTYSQSWGGTRPGAGRPKKEPSTVVRLPLRVVEQLPRLLALLESKTLIDLRGIEIHEIEIESPPSTRKVPPSAQNNQVIEEAVFIKDLERMGYEILLPEQQ